MKKIKLAFLLLALMLLSAACAPAADNMDNSGDAAQSGDVSLSTDELDQFTDFLMQPANNGFLLSNYDDPADIDLDEVLYNGAGIPDSTSQENNLDAEEKAAYLAASGNKEIYGDLNRLTSEQINDLLLAKTGLMLDQMNTSLTWTYLPEYDTWYREVFDFNGIDIVCSSGYRTTDDYLVLDYQPAPDSYGKTGTVTLRDNGDGYQFVANSSRETE